MFCVADLLNVIADNTAEPENMPIKIEYKTVVDTLVATEAYFVPASDEYPAALHLVVGDQYDHENAALPSSAVMGDQGTFD